ncbi:hypothetical protein LXA43DRAFT_134220 [Ganoderma leucocontextum]|nr:hypothetical protein LXA43DRAFT_134220 [Ganoderma leucocontextum]
MLTRCLWATGFGSTHLALLFYGFLITLHREVRRIWSRGHVGITLLYAGTRYSAVVARLISTLAWITMGRPELSECEGARIVNLIAPATSCSLLLWLQGVAEVAMFLSTTVFSSLRAYALSGKRPWVPVVTLILGLALPAAHAMSYRELHPNPIRRLLVAILVRVFL